MLTMEQFEEQFEEGNLSKRFSSNNRFCIFNYTLKVQLEKRWNDVTLNSRGTIFDLYTKRMIARGLPKFFNVGETRDNHFGNLAKRAQICGGFQAADKMDGSCGIVYFDRYQDKLCVATRGSFESEQAIWATKYLDDLDDSVHKKIKEVMGDYKKTPIFEIVYPENRIIVDYKGKTGLFLIQVVDIESGKTFSYSEVLSLSQDIGVPCAEHCENIYDLSQLKYFKENADNGIEKEGWVVRFNDGHLVKFKLDDYMKIAKALYHFGPKVVFNLAREGKDLVKYFVENELPDELFNGSEAFYKKVRQEFNELLEGVYDDFRFVLHSVGKEKERKDYAIFMKENGMNRFIGSFFDWKNKKDISEFVWNKMLDYRDFEWNL